MKKLRNISGALLFCTLTFCLTFGIIQNKNVEANIPWINLCNNCASGGVGATSCSIEGGSFGCSVTCGPGYSACCNLFFGCHCCASEPL